MGPMQSVVINRYQVLQKLGEGGMGSVFRVYDLLTDTIVALKQVLVPAFQLQPIGTNDVQKAYVALANEFRTLANLRHPHVIRVLDYGFDEQGTPFFTMEYLPSARPITYFKLGENPTQQQDIYIEHITQALQALAYLHRRGIIHRDIKPENMLINQDEQVKVLDFGLAQEFVVDTEAERKVVGTMAYIAPEILMKEPATVQSDLYAIGIIIHEMLQGRHPFDVSSFTKLMNDTLFKLPNLASVDERFVNLLERLLAKKPEKRPKSAYEVIAELYQALALPLPEETTSIRDSYLQASRFIGRETEFEQLNNALKSLAEEKKSSFWLVGGESGIGKSRLIEEIRIRALVRGIKVLRGQAVEDGGLPYQMWREVIRPLALMTEISDIEASTLKEIVPDMGKLLQRDIPDTDVLMGKAHRERLALTILEVLKRYGQKFLLLLEDLQWTHESLDILKTLLHLSDQFSAPLMIIGTYRTEEAKTLPEQLAPMQVMQLERFDKDAVAMLSLSMLGSAGENKELQKLVAEQTEGNIFFIVEVMRALAEEAGRLDDIGREGLLERVMSGGMQAVLKRRLAGIPAELHRLLQLAALAGRRLDPNLLAVLADKSEIDALITAGANTSVFDVADGAWRFAHDKLRDTVLAEIAADQQAPLHRLIAEAIEQTYPQDDDYAETLAMHWHVAGDVQKTIHYTLIASKDLVEIFAEYDRAKTMLDRVLQLAEHVPNAAQYLSTVYDLLAGIEKRYGKYQTAIEYYQSLAYAGPVLHLQAHALNLLSETSLKVTDYVEAEAYAKHALEIAEVSQNNKERAFALRNLGSISEIRGDYQAALVSLDQSISILQRLPNESFQLAFSLLRLGILHSILGNDEPALSNFEQSLAIQRKLGNQMGVADALINLGVTVLAKGELDAAKGYFQEALSISQNFSIKTNIVACLCSLGEVAMAQGHSSAAIDYFDDSLAMSREIDDETSTVYILNVRAHASLNLKEKWLAKQDLEEAWRLSQELKHIGLQLMTMIVVAQLRFENGNRLGAAQIVGFVEQHPSASSEDKHFHLEPLKLKLQELPERVEFMQAMEEGQKISFEIFAREFEEELRTS